MTTAHNQEPEDGHDNDKDRSSGAQRWSLHPACLQLALHLPVLRLSLLLQDLLPHLHPRPLPRPPRPPRPPLPCRPSSQLKTESREQPGVGGVGGEEEGGGAVAWRGWG